MIQSGLVSVTFRKLAPEEIIKLVATAGLDAIEWGGDIHVPHGNEKIAKKVGTMTKDAGLQVAAYGSYYRVGCNQPADREFEKVLAAAIGLGAPAIRVWAGNRGSELADEAWWEQVIEDARRVADMAMRENISVDFEYHGRTLTDTNDAVLRLLQGVQHPNIRCYWQPRDHESVQQHIEGISLIEPWLANIHVFHWQSYEHRFPLPEGKSRWLQYMPVFRKTGRTHCMMLEFVRNDEPDQFLADAEALKTILFESSTVF